MTHDLYAVLGVRKNASRKTIQKAFRKRSLEEHPDRNPGDEGAQARFEAVKLAWEVLGDEARRKRYDETGDTSAPKSAAEFDPLTVQAMQLLSGALQNIINQLLGQGAEPAAVDMLALLRSAIDEGERPVLDNRSKILKAQRALSELIGRFKCADDHENVLNGIARSHLACVEANLRQLDEQLARIQRARKLLAEFSFDQKASPWADLMSAMSAQRVRMLHFNVQSAAAS